MWERSSIWTTGTESWSPSPTTLTPSSTTWLRTSSTRPASSLSQWVPSGCFFFLLLSNLLSFSVLFIVVEQMKSSLNNLRLVCWHFFESQRPKYPRGFSRMGAMAWGQCILTIEANGYLTLSAQQTKNPHINNAGRRHTYMKDTSDTS